MNWIPPNKSAGVPWAREVADITRGAPKTSRIPTGGWRSYGAVPSNTYAQDEGYWAGLGQMAGTLGGFGQTAVTTTATATQPSGMQIFANVVGSLGTAAASIYSTYTQGQTATSAIRRGVPAPVITPLPTTTQPMYQAPRTVAKSNMPLILGGVGVAAVLGFMMMRKKR